MKPEDREFILRWAQERGIPFLEEDIPFLHQQISGLGLEVARWCELQDRQQADLDAHFAPKKKG
jgi:hypothetical protein